MACVGRTKVCTIVPSNHFGPIPGVHVGTLWKFRVQVSVTINSIDHYVISTVAKNSTVYCICRQN